MGFINQKANYQMNWTILNVILILIQKIQQKLFSIENIIK